MFYLFSHFILFRSTDFSLTLMLLKIIRNLELVVSNRLRNSSIVKIYDFFNSKIGLINKCQEVIMSEDVPQWAKDLKDDKVVGQKNSNGGKLPDPFGIKKLEIEGQKAPKVIDHDAQNRIAKLTAERAWQISSEPLKSVPMNIIMSYMSGNSLQIIPIMTAIMLVSNPFKSILGVKSKFQHLINKDNDVTPPVVAAMIMYIIYQLILMGIGLHKLNSMGLFPTTSSDWLAWQQPTEYLYRTLGV